MFYYHLKQGVHFDAALYYGQATRIWLRATGYPKGRLYATIELFSIPEETLGAFVSEMAASALG